MVTRVGGLASGMDIDSLVEKLMNAERVPLNKLNQKKQTYEWQRDAYRTVNSKLKTFSDYLFDNFSLTSNFAKKNSSVTGTNSSKVSISAGSSATGSLNIQSIKQIATAARVDITNVEHTSKRYAVGNDKLTDMGVTAGEFNLTVTKTVDGVATTTKEAILIDANTTVDNLVAQFKAAGLDTTKFDVNTGQFNIGGTNVSYSAADLSSIDKLKELGFSTTSTSKALQIETDEGKKVNAKKDELLSTFKLNVGSFSVETSEGAKIITVEADDTIESFVNRLNLEGTGLRASFNASSGKLSITDKEGKEVKATSDLDYQELEKLGISTTSSKSTTGYFTDESVAKAPTGSTALGHLGLEDGSFTLNVIQADGSTKKTTIQYNKTDTIDTFVKRLNASGAGVTALFSNGKMSLSANNTGKVNDGSTNEIQVVNDGTDNGKNLFTALGFSTNSVGSTKDGVETFDLASTHGQNAEYAINGLVMESQSNTFSVSGYSITLNGTFNETSIKDDGSLDVPSTGGVTVSSSNDIDAMVDKVKEFVAKYNELIAGLNDQVKETKYRDYKPLTSEQRKEMSESEQKLWDEKAKSGLLRSDAILRNGLSDMRSAIYGQVAGLGDNVIDTMAEMGITTSSSFNDGGKLIIDEAKLRKALTDDPDKVVQTITQSGKKDAAEGDTRGIVQRLRESMTQFTKNIESKAGRSTMTNNQYSIGKSLIDTDSRITALTARLKDIETRYWKQFTAMETAINKANTQSGYLSQFSAQ
ncbi:flagellar filament capping protein FliD [Viridibacillus sp. NPDC096237]|uniref:flagellar filament capping protein FliD n=1 Tax=Viridibacillus sp. NPDC096237 TaxID=3390721 RepID=UPI003D00A3AE